MRYLAHNLAQRSFRCESEFRASFRDCVFTRSPHTHTRPPDGRQRSLNLERFQSTGIYLYLRHFRINICTVNIECAIHRGLSQYKPNTGTNCPRCSRILGQKNVSINISHDWRLFAISFGNMRGAHQQNVRMQSDTVGPIIFKRFSI